ncbi:aminotransferase class III-fold pyridoxal phosphate-dependent enzyme [candidate division KSB1 bacterium]|nr:aminotransferase class III-fold pyridoxal phosphate-dependent enzyme [candidate division KSB1 bacterium]
MNSQEMIELCQKHTIYEWSSIESVNPIPVAKAQGVYFWTPEGKRFIDFNSQLMCVNIGHAHPKVIKAMKNALDDLIYVYPLTATESRAKLGKKLAQIVPGNINTFFFTVGGAEANENAIRAARLYTGRQKILSRYRSYHGGSHLCMQLTGDPRRIPNEPGTPGIVHVLDPQPYNYSFGNSEEEITKDNLIYLDEVIQYEGPNNIAAMIVETVTGTNGILVPPKGYLQGLHELLNQYDILLICDEIMSGFGRTGKMFAFEHFGIIPDIVTMAKGLTSAYIPLGCVGVSDAIADHFRKNVFWGGLTYNSHPLALNTAMAVIEVIQEEDLAENAARLGKIMRDEMDRLTRKHPSVKEGRCIGLFGMIDIQKNASGELIAPYNGTSEPMKKLANFFREEGLFTFLRWASFMCNPPLCITEKQLLEGFEIIDRGLDLTDQAFEG